MNYAFNTHPNKLLDIRNNLNYRMIAFTDMAGIVHGITMIITNPIKVPSMLVIQHLHDVFSITGNISAYLELSVPNRYESLNITNNILTSSLKSLK